MKTRCWLVVGMLMIGCGQVASPGDSADEADSGADQDTDNADDNTDNDDAPGIDAADSPDAAWAAQPSVAIVAPGIIDVFCAPPGSFEITITGPGGTTVDLSLGVIGGTLDDNVTGPHTIGSDGTLDLAVDVASFNAGTMTVTVEILDEHDRSSEASDSASTTSGAVC